MPAHPDLGQLPRAVGHSFYSALVGAHIDCCQNSGSTIAAVGAPNCEFTRGASDALFS